MKRSSMGCRSLQFWAGVFLGFSSFAVGLDCGEEIRSLVIFGPYSSGQELARTAKNRGYQTIGIVSDPHPAGYQDRPEDLDHRLVYPGDVPQIVDRLLRIPGRIKSVLAGSEWNPMLADLVRQELRNRGIATVGNTAEKAVSRRDKAEFGRVLAAAGVPHVRQRASNRLQDLLKWYRMLGETEVVVKPPRGCGTRDVYFCRSEKEITTAFHKILTGKRNPDVEFDHEVILQEKLRGQEYAINGVVVDGFAYFTGIWKYDREVQEGYASIYVADRLMPADLTRFRHLMRQVRRVLHATGTDYGAFHIELIDDPDKGPIAIDFGARGSGGGLLDLEKAATDRDPYDLVLRSQLAPQSFPGENFLYQQRRQAAVVFISTDGGAVASHAVASQLDVMREKGEVFDYSFGYEEGQQMPRTVDSDTVVASVRILADSESELEARIQSLFALQKSRAFESRLANESKERRRWIVIPKFLRW